MVSRLASRLAAGTLVAYLLTSAGAGALEADPAALYERMKQVYAQTVARGNSFAELLNYQAAILDAGRAYALFKRDDPLYGEVATLAVDIATRLHYDPLLNDDASLWYMRDATVWVGEHGDATHAGEAKTLAEKIAAGENLTALARQAEDDARAIVIDFHRDPEALVRRVVVDVRAYNVTLDPRYRELLLVDAADPRLRLARIPDEERNELFSTVAAALRAGSEFSKDERLLALAIEGRRRAILASSKGSARPPLARMAPADQYFGPFRLSPLGVGNEIVRINSYLDAGWGERMATEALNVASALEDWQHQYPRDPTLPRHLFELYSLLDRIGAPSLGAEAANLRTILLVQYAGSPQARDLSRSLASLSSAPATSASPALAPATSAPSASPSPGSTASSLPSPQPFVKAMPRPVLTLSPR